MNNSEIVRRYFQSWIDKDRTIVNGCFAETVRYVECYGPVYEGLAQVQRWFDEWNRKGSVLEWRIEGIVDVDNRCFVEWFFKCDYEGSVGGFDGVSIVEFDADDRISLVREYQSKHEHHFPYRAVLAADIQGTTPT